MSEEVKNPTQQRPKLQPGQPTEYMVIVRHSPLLLKSAVVVAGSEAEAKKIFLERAKEVHEKRANKLATTPGMEPKEAMMAAQRCKDDYANTVNDPRSGNSRVDALAWSIMTKAEYDAKQRRQFEAQERALAEMQKATTGVTAAV